MTGLEYIRWFYKVPAWEGRRITYKSTAGVIVGYSGPYLLARLEGHEDEDPAILHPTWNVAYLDDIEVPA